MRSVEEIKAMRERFEKDLQLDEDDEELNAIVDTLNWVLGDSDEMENYLSV